MKACHARSLSFANNQAAKGITEIDKLIMDACKVGDFGISFKIQDAWGSTHNLRTHYEDEGFMVSSSHQQTSPNDGDDYLHLKW